MKHLRMVIVVAYCVAIAIAVVYVPWKIDFEAKGYSGAQDYGYSLITYSPVDGATVDYGRVVLACAGITAVAGIAYVLAGLRTSKV